MVVERESEVFFTRALWNRKSLTNPSIKNLLLAKKRGRNFYPSLVFRF